MLRVPVGTMVVATAADGDHRGIVHGYRYNLLAGREEIVLIPAEHQGMLLFVAALNVRPDSEATRGGDL